MAFEMGGLIAIALIIAAVFGLVSGGKKKIARWLSFAALAALLIVASVFGAIFLLENYYKTIGIFGFFLIILFVSIAAVILVHRYYAGKGGEYSSKEMDKLTVNAIRGLKKLKLSPLGTALLGAGFLAAAFFVVSQQYNCPYLCSMRFYSIACLWCYSLFFGLVIFLPLGLFFASIAFIWNKNKEKF